MGSPLNNGNSFFSSSFFGFFFDPHIEDFSYGIGFSPKKHKCVPEPGTMLAVVGGIGTLLARRLKRSA